MTSSGATLRFVERFHRLDCRRAIRVAAPAMALVIVIDHATGAELSLATMYLLPIMLVSWCCGLRHGLVFAAAAIASQVVLGMVQGHPFSRTLYFAIAVLNRGTSFVLIAMLTAGLRRMHERERRFARIDPLCGIANRLQFDDTIERELPRHARSHKPLCVAYLDCDDFKVVNDRLGHGEGDRLLRAMGLPE
jgi:predicted signal transduction protein with EAL and GGDEF domain